MDINSAEPNGDKRQCNTFKVLSADDKVEWKHAVSLYSMSVSENVATTFHIYPYVPCVCELSAAVFTSE